MFTNIKYDIYQKMGEIFPKYFKNKVFGTLKKNIDLKITTKLPEKELLILHLFINPNSVIVDIGANNGLYCYYFQEIIKSKTIYAFEPIPTLYSKLNKWFSGIHFSPIAISDSNGSNTIKIPFIDNVKYETRAKLDELKENNETKNIEINIQTATLDSFFSSKNTSINFIKIDVEGHELSVLKGAEKLIKKDLPILMVEIEARHHNKQIQTVIDFITNLQYEVFYYDLEEKKLKNYIDFNLIKNQNLNEPNNHLYINNFLCFPNNVIDLVSINSKITTI